jgi:hypothetical protein
MGHDLIRKNEQTNLSQTPSFGHKLERVINMMVKEGRGTRNELCDRFFELF